MYVSINLSIYAYGVNSRITRSSVGGVLYGSNWPFHSLLNSDASRPTHNCLSRVKGVWVYPLQIPPPSRQRVKG